MNAVTRPRRKLPIGIQTFAEIRQENHYYVDKTPQILRLIDEGKYYFLSRPRRFGKSLLLDTIAELFEGNRALFEGLHADAHWDWSRQFPVIRISFSDGVLRSQPALEQKTRELLSAQQKRHGIECHNTSISGWFAELIQELHQRCGERVVVLIDEYDKPILDNLTEPDVARAMRDGLRDLYSVLKGQDAHIKFTLLTGVSKFSKVSLFSGLNNLTDITVDKAYSALCGYTDADVDQIFAPELPGLDRDEIRRWYNGYNWTGTSVYNPFDLLLLFRNREFKSYWFETGTPTFLVDLLAERQAWLPELGQLETDAELLSAFDVDYIATEALMFQAGYLTIAEVINLGDTYFYRLRYPNREVEQSLNNRLLMRWMPEGTSSVKRRMSLYQRLQANDFAGLRELFTAFFASIPNDWYRSNRIAQYEGYYASVFYSHFAALGLEIRLEDVTNRGRIDMTVLFNRQVYLFEFKVVELVPQGRALQQIRERGYADKYRARGEPIHLIGVEFSREQRSVVGFEVESWAP